MKISFKLQFFFAVCTMLLATAICPQQGVAQRFNHGGGGGGNARAPMPVYHPAPSPAPMRRQETPVVQPNRATINGGGRNIGNHDFNRNANVNVHENVTVRENVPTHENAPLRQIGRENEHIYHTGAYRGLHPYTYHPYHPFYWGPRWHPNGFFLSSLAANALRFSIANQWYYYADGCYYIPYNGGYSVVPPPIGAVVSYLPDGYETVLVGNDYFYYYGGAFYIAIPQGYQVVQAPPGAVVSQLPVGAVEQDINGETLLVYNNTYYQPISQDGQDAYEVVPVN
jgi:hypothetical protein